MKKILTILILFGSVNLFAQSYPISVSLSFPNNPNANTINWGDGSSMLMIKASAKSVGARIDPSLEESKILLIIKKGSSKICGAYTGNSAPAANFNSAMKVWVGKNASALLGQNCVLSPGDYTICVQFFGNTAGGFKPFSEEISKPFFIKSDDQKAPGRRANTNTTDGAALAGVHVITTDGTDTRSSVNGKARVTGSHTDAEGKSKANNSASGNNGGNDTIANTSLYLKVIHTNKTITRNWIADDTSSNVKVSGGGTNNNSKSYQMQRNSADDYASSTKVDNKLKIEDENKTKQSSVACDCNKDMYVIAQVNSTGYKIRCRETMLFNLGTTIHFIPQNICNPANCLTDWNMAVNDAQSGAFITSGTVTSNTSSIALTMNSVNGYKITWSGHCNGKKCECEFWIKKK